MQLKQLEHNVLQIKKTVQDLLKDIRALKADSDDAFWQEASQETLKKIWDNEEDDVYAQ